MTTVTISALTSTDASPKQQKKLRQLWADVEKKQQRNQRYQAKLDKFYQEFKQQIEPLEQEVCFATEAWIRHLIAFVPRKSIKGKQRESLYEWIEEELEIIESNPFNPVNTRDLRETFTALLVERSESEAQGVTFSQEDLNQVRDELSQILGEPVKISDEELGVLVTSPEKLQEFVFSFLDEKARESADDEAEDATFYFDDFFEQSQQAGEDDDHVSDDQPGGAAILFDDKRMAKLYRQLAKLLHPDRERDPAKQAEKQGLMQQLSQAKKDKDPLALLLLAQRFLPDHELALDNDMLRHLEVSLKAKVTQLSQEYEALQHGGKDMKSVIWHRFGGGNKASRQRVLDKYRYQLIDGADELRTQCEEITTVKELQNHLKVRVDQRIQLEQVFMDSGLFM
ncbi:J domain-containing protein [Salinivibrio socompensis]|uniref:J domain-containing protein n=1 Tax=Salinivibrio socompensis TaxID=1510206 RepID=UPI0004AC6F64|nr:J domain-containing protein [Salinivibrio socompensis]